MNMQILWHDRYMQALTTTMLTWQTRTEWAPLVKGLARETRGM